MARSVVVGVASDDAALQFLVAISQCARSFAACGFGREIDLMAREGCRIYIGYSEVALQQEANGVGLFHASGTAQAPESINYQHVAL